VLSVRHAGQSADAYEVEPAGASVIAPAAAVEDAGAGLGAGSATVGGAAGVGCGAGAIVVAGVGFAAFRRFAATGFFLGFAARPTTFFLALVAPFFARAWDFKTRLFVLLLDFALGLADRLVFAFLAIRWAPLLR